MPTSTIGDTDYEEVEFFDLTDFAPPKGVSLDLERYSEIEVDQERAISIYCNSVYIENGWWYFDRKDKHGHKLSGACGHRGFKFPYRKYDSAHIVGQCRPDGPFVRKIYRR